MSSVGMSLQEKNFAHEMMYGNFSPFGLLITDVLVASSREEKLSHVKRVIDKHLPAEEKKKKEKIQDSFDQAIQNMVRGTIAKTLEGLSKREPSSVAAPNKDVVDNRESILKKWEEDPSVLLEMEPTKSNLDYLRNEFLQKLLIEITHEDWFSSARLSSKE